ncbi:hypothetical protein B0H16DRAFT_1697975 [Mycena metata]|uniref:Uncharacterized protein n=1 Tax=Mycena metata TaxID=1033252 RepID=A0AAD7HRQ9_9AGAR|nr:hypothetical protein B0H16DRAFT_1697975 [Mycena metata]
MKRKNWKKNLGTGSEGKWQQKYQEIPPSLGCNGLVTVLGPLPPTTWYSRSRTRASRASLSSSFPSSYLGLRLGLKLQLDHGTRLIAPWVVGSSLRLVWKLQPRLRRSCPENCGQFPKAQFFQCIITSSRCNSRLNTQPNPIADASLQVPDRVNFYPTTKRSKPDRRARGGKAHSNWVELGHVWIRRLIPIPVNPRPSRARADPNAPSAPTASNSRRFDASKAAWGGVGCGYGYGYGGGREGRTGGEKVEKWGVDTASLRGARKLGPRARIDVRTHTAFALTAGASARIVQVHATRRGCVGKRERERKTGRRRREMGRGQVRWERGGKGGGTRGERMGWGWDGHEAATRRRERQHTTLGYRECGKGRWSGEEDGKRMTRHKYEGLDERAAAASARTRRSRGVRYTAPGARDSARARCAAVYTRAEKRVVTEGDGTRACAMGTAPPTQGDKRGSGRWERGGKGTGTRGEVGDGEMGWAGEEAAVSRDSRRTVSPHVRGSSMYSDQARCSGGKAGRAREAWTRRRKQPARDVGYREWGKGGEEDGRGRRAEAAHRGDSAARRIAGGGGIDGAVHGDSTRREPRAVVHRRGGGLDWQARAASTPSYFGGWGDGDELARAGGMDTKSEADGARKRAAICKQCETAHVFGGAVDVARLIQLWSAVRVLIGLCITS